MAGIEPLLKHTSPSGNVFQYYSKDASAKSPMHASNEMLSKKTPLTIGLVRIYKIILRICLNDSRFFNDRL